jgi:hypothetical protein
MEEHITSYFVCLLLTTVSGVWRLYNFISVLADFLTFDVYVIILVGSCADVLFLSDICDRLLTSVAFTSHTAIMQDVRSRVEDLVAYDVKY